MSWCLRRGPGLSKVCLCLSDIGSLGFSSCLGDDFKTPFGGVWGELPRLLRRWGTPTLGALLFSLSV